ncbi:hypothetical protein [Streptomyces sp. NPDC018045]|uniref:hypothetical protein n=1 Tax=Streptomyces sp. NPDC018045 TaxID=3365037 RepID=UPI0037A6AF7A
MTMVLALSALSVFAVAGCSSGEQDKRAYPGTSSGQSLEHVMDRFKLKLPSCDVKEVGFSGSARYPEEKLSLSFRAPRPCVEKFLQEHGVSKVKDPYHWPSGRVVSGDSDPAPEPPFLEAETKRFGWKFDPRKLYNVYSDFHTSNGSLFKVLGEPHGDTETLYLQSTYAGGS